MNDILNEGIVNLSHIQVNKRLKHFIKNNCLACQCDICINDIKSYALNKLPPNYIANHLEVPSTKYIETPVLDDVLRSAILTIKKHPHH